MSILLHINTALDTASAGISSGTTLLAWRENILQKEHASFLQPAIRDICAESGISLRDIDAVTVVNGPGSYTGLRVGLSAAKGICYALRKPLVTLSTLEWLARPFLQADTRYICPLIDARRMEVFTATYDRNLQCIHQPHALILGDGSFSDLLSGGPVIFTGNGAEKLPGAVLAHAHATTKPSMSGLPEQVAMGLQAFFEGKFADPAYAEPFYVKAFFTTATTGKNS